MTSPTASELNQGKELTEAGVQALRKESVRRLERWPESAERSDAAKVLALCDAWLSSRSSEAPSRRGELPDVDTLAQIIRRVDGDHSLGAGALAEAIVEALNKNTGGAS